MLHAQLYFLFVFDFPEMVAPYLKCIFVWGSIKFLFLFLFLLYITRKYVMNQTNTHNNILFTHIARCPGGLSLVEKYTGHVRSRVRTCPAPWGMSAQEHTFTFCQIFFISGGNYTLITCIQYTTMVTHSQCEISQSWRSQFSSHGALNLNRAVMPPLPLHGPDVKLIH